MNTHLTKLLEYLRSIDPKSCMSLDWVVGKCFENKFPTGVIIAGIGVYYAIPHIDAKRIVAEHPKSNHNFSDLNRFHDEMEQLNGAGDENLP